MSRDSVYLRSLCIRVLYLDYFSAIAELQTAKWSTSAEEIRARRSEISLFFLPSTRLASSTRFQLTRDIAR